MLNRLCIEWDDRRFSIRDKRDAFDANFRRMWEYYLCYCEVGFRNNAIDVGFFKLKPIPVRA